MKKLTYYTRRDIHTEEHTHGRDIQIEGRTHERTYTWWSVPTAERTWGRDMHTEEHTHGGNIHIKEQTYRETYTPRKNEK